MKRRLTVLLGAAMLAGWAVPAWAHVTAEDPSVPKVTSKNPAPTVQIVDESGEKHCDGPDCHE
jgi:hypothetical protein